MRIALVTPRFQASDPTAPEQLAAELATRASGRWAPTVLTTTAGGPGDAGFSEGQTQHETARVHRFAFTDPGEGGGGGSFADRLVSEGLLAHLSEYAENDFDLIAVFGSQPALSRAAVAVAPNRTVLLPFAEEVTGGDASGEAFEHPAAFLFGSEAEEVQVLKRYGVHRRMRETVAGTLLLPRSADAAGFRKKSGLAGSYVVHAGPAEPGRGIEEFVRYFSTFKDRRREAPLDLVLFGPSSLKLPRRPDVRVLDAPDAKLRLDAVVGALIAVVPERLASFTTAAVEPFSVGAPILVNASASALVDDCKTSGGGLWYRNYEELELILELGLRDPRLFARLGAAGREFLTSRNDWDVVIKNYDRAFRSFARPSRAGEAGLTDSPEPVVAADPEVESPAADPEVEAEAEEPPAPEESPVEPESVVAAPEPEPEPQPEPEPAAADEADPFGETHVSVPDATGDASPPVVSAPAPSPAAEPEAPAEVEPAESKPAESETPEPKPEVPDDESSDDPATKGLPSFFQSSIRDR